MALSEPPLLALGKAMKEAAEHEDWETLAELHRQFENDCKNQHLTAQDKASVTQALALLNDSIAKVTRRREEIRTLVNNLGDSPL